jgi:hypothetical protein
MDMNISNDIVMKIFLSNLYHTVSINIPMEKPMRVKCVIKRQKANI